MLGRTLNSASGQNAVASRNKLVLPRPASAAAAIPRGAQLRIPGISPFTTPNSSFYRVDTALVVPKVNAATWRLRIHGTGVRRPVTLSFDDLLRRELIERDITLTCVSNEVGGPYVGNARWIGVRLAELLAECGVRPPSKGGSADQLVARSVDGMTIGSPVEDVMDGRDALLALGMNGEPLPFAHGFPVRMVVPGLYGFVSACKWIKDIELTTFDSYDPYWVKRGWARRAPIKTESRIDTPKPFARPSAGTVMVGGRLGPAPRYRQGRGARRRRPLAGGTTRRRGHPRHLAPVVLPLGGHQGRSHAHRPRHRPRRPATDRQAHPHHSRRGERVALRGRDRRLTPQGTLSVPRITKQTWFPTAYLSGAVRSPG